MILKIFRVKSLFTFVALELQLSKKIEERDAKGSERVSFSALLGTPFPLQFLVASVAASIAAVGASLALHPLRSIEDLEADVAAEPALKALLGVGRHSFLSEKAVKVEVGSEILCQLLVDLLEELLLALFAAEVVK